MGAENGGVVGMLEVIQSDFARLETDTKASEAQAQQEFDRFSSESAVHRAAKAKDVEHKTTKKTNQEGALTSKKADLEGTPHRERVTACRQRGANCSAQSASDRSS